MRAIVCGLVAVLSTQTLAAQSDTTRRPHAIEYSGMYYTRLKIHQIGAIAILPLAGGEYFLGDQLLNKSNPASWVKPTHVGVATALGVAFASNTVTGAWNLWDSRHDSHGRVRRYLHTGLMLSSDAMMLLAAQSAGSAKQSLSDGRHHRDFAITAFGLSTAGTVMMWLWKD